MPVLSVHKATSKEADSVSQNPSTAFLLTEELKTPTGIHKLLRGERAESLANRQARSPPQMAPNWPTCRPEVGSLVGAVRRLSGL